MKLSDLLSAADLGPRLRARLYGAHENIASFGYQGPRPEPQQNGGRLTEIFWSNRGRTVHKWHHYLPVYEQYLGRYVGTPVRMLEIGVFRGGSLDMWRSFFGPEAKLFGIDIDPNCAQYDGLSGQVRIGSQDDPDFLRRVVAEMGGVDVVLDDGSHVSKHIRSSLDVLFPLLADDGIYLIEDLHAAYWRRFGAGYRASGSFIEDVKTLIDDLHHWYHRKGQRIAATKDRVRAIHVYDSLVVLEKDVIERPRHTKVGADHPS